MHRLLDSQLSEARRADGTTDLDVLVEMVAKTYAASDEARLSAARVLSDKIAEIDAAQARLRDAFEVLPEGLILFDADDRVVVWNRRYQEQIAPFAEHLRVGMTFEEVLRFGLSVGGFPEAIGHEEAWLADRMRRHRLPVNIEERRTADGRWLRIEETRTRDGGSVGARIDITELKHREASFRLLLESNPVPMWVFDAETFRFLSVNDSAVAHYGYSRERFAEMSIFDIRAPESFAATRKAVAATLSDRPIDHDWRHLRADGTPIDVRVFARPLIYEGRDSVLVAAIDVTDRKRAEDQLEEMREFLDAIIENVPTTIFVKDPRTHRYLLINRAGEQLFGRAREEIVGKRDEDLFDPSAAAVVRALEEDLLHGDGGEIGGQETMETPHAGTRLLSVNRLAVRDEAGAARFLLGVAEDVTEKRRAADRIAFLAHHDALTGLPNRAAFMDRLAVSMEEAEREGRAFAVFSIDLDRFKSVNDVFGHPAGDVLLQQVAERLRGLSDEAFVARLGGDEFMVICRGEPQPGASEELARRLKEAMIEEFDLPNHRVRSCASVGVAIFPTDGRDATTLLANADAALYRAKADGRDTVRFFEAEMDRMLRDRRSLQTDLDRALERGEFSLHFQPQARLDGTVVGFEALLRWTHPVRGSVSPEVFVPLAEEGSLIDDISAWVLREACRTAAAWTRPLTVAVNLSPVQFRHGDLPSFVHRVLLETGLSPGRLELEITEGVLISDFARTVGLLRRLKAMGVKIAMDDFGTGYSSLSYLQAFPFDKIKIDRSFVGTLGRDDQSSAIVRAVIGLCRGLALPVIAEGVETEDQRAFLSGEHCDEIQGYLIGRPRPIADYAALVGDGRAPPEARLRAEA